MKIQNESTNEVENGVVESNSDCAIEVHDNPDNYNLIDERKMTYYDYVSDSDIESFLATEKRQHRLIKDLSSQEQHCSTSKNDTDSCSQQSFQKDTAMCALMNPQSKGKMAKNKLYILENDKNTNIVFNRGSADTSSDTDETICLSTQFPTGSSRSISERHSYQNVETTQNDAITNLYVPLQLNDMEYLNNYSPLTIPLSGSKDKNDS